MIKATLGKEKGTRGIRLPVFKAILIKTVSHWHKNRNLDQCKPMRLWAISLWQRKQVYTMVNLAFLNALEFSSSVTPVSILWHPYSFLR